MNKKHLIHLLSAGVFVGFATSAMANVTAVDSFHPELPPEPEKAQALVVVPQPELVHRVSLDRVADSEIEAMMERNQHQKRMEIGLGRDLTADQQAFRLSELHWQRLADGSRVAHLEVHSPEARALRAGVQATGLPKGLNLRFYTAGEARVAGDAMTPAHMRRLAGKETGVYWSPTVSGDTLGVEVHAKAGVELGRSELRIPQLSHLLTSVEDNFQFKDLSGIGQSGACNVDVACESDAQWRDVADSVAKYSFVRGGSSFMCTGSLLNDEGDTGTPYFLTANHCVDSQTVASTIETYWFFQREQCGGADPTSVTSRSNGGDLLATGADTDYTLIELNDTPPNGVVFAGWTTNTLSNGEEVIAIHHPAGDLKKISFGDKQGYSSYLSSSNNPDANYIRTIWSVSGTTEGGSSGSALFNDNYQVIGNLHGGYAGCSGSVDNGEPDWYGRFDYTHNCVADWVGGTAAGECGSDGGGGTEPGREDVTELQDGVSRSGSVAAGAWSDYSIEVSSGTNRLTVNLTGMNADGDLYVRHNSQPTLNNFECRSWEGGTSNEVCRIDDPASGTWYIGVNGWETTDYTVKASLGSGGGGSSGGCQLAKNNRLDPLMPILALLALAGLVRRGQRLRLTR